MRKPLSLIVVIVCLTLLVGSTAWAGSRGRDLPHRYLPNSLDGRLVQVMSPVDGTLWAAWAYRDGAQYDLAVAFRDEQGFWSEPMLIGANDGLDQTQPALAADWRGNVYLAYNEESLDQIMLCWLEAGAAGWSTPFALTGPDVPAAHPALRVVGERLVVGFRSGRGLVLLDLPLLPDTMTGAMIEDGPDPVGARDGIDPPESNPDEDADPLVPLDDTGTSAWSSTAPS